MTTPTGQEWWRGSFDEIKGEEAIKNCDGGQMFNGKWWMPKWGCDTLDHLNDAYNASIAAERQATQHFTLMWDIACKQLAAERESMAHELELAMEAMIENKQLREQLAAANVGNPCKGTPMFILNRSLMLENQQLRKQLDSAVEALTHMVKLIDLDEPVQAIGVGKAALAKLGEGKSI